MLRQMILMFKNMRLVYLMSAILIYLLVPFLCWQIALAEPLANGPMFSLLQVFLSVIPLTWALFYLREYLEGEGCEVLYVYERFPKIRYLLLFLVPFAIQLLPIFLGLHLFKSNMWLEYMIIIFQAYFLISLFYFCTYLLRSSLMGFYLTLLYVFSVKFLVAGDSIYKIYVSSVELFSRDQMILLAVISIILILWGAYLERRYSGC